MNTHEVALTKGEGLATCTRSRSPARHSPLQSWRRFRRMGDGRSDCCLTSIDRLSEKAAKSSVIASLSRRSNTPSREPNAPASPHEIKTRSKKWESWVKCRRRSYLHLSATDPHKQSRQARPTRPDDREPEQFQRARLGRVYWPAAATAWLAAPLVLLTWAIILKFGSYSCHEVQRVWHTFNVIS